MKTQRGDRKLRVEKEVKVYTSVYTKELTAAASRERKNTDCSVKRVHGNQLRFCKHIPENFSLVKMIEMIKKHCVEFMSPVQHFTHCPVRRTAGVSVGR